MIDLRSDTVTRPSADMLAAMAQAELGDDVYGEDPSVTALESEVARRFGREAALFCATGSLSNLLGVWLHTPPGREVLCDSYAHIARADPQDPGGAEQCGPVLSDAGATVAALVLSCPIPRYGRGAVPRLLM